jgi:hypothetical protein
MKTSRSTLTRQSKQGNSKKPKPEIRDDMDSRKKKPNTEAKRKDHLKKADHEND